MFLLPEDALRELKYYMGTAVPVEHWWVKYNVMI